MKGESGGEGTMWLGGASDVQNEHVYKLGILKSIDNGNNGYMYMHRWVEGLF